MSNPFADPSESAYGGAGNPFTDPQEDGPTVHSNPFSSGDSAYDYVSLDEGGNSSSNGRGYDGSRGDGGSSERFPGEEEELHRTTQQQDLESQTIPPRRQESDPSGRRSSEIALREERIAELQKQGKQARAKNWPSRCLPLLYHSIVDEIPSDRRGMVRLLYSQVLLAWLGFLVNLIALIVIWAEENEYGNSVLWAIGYLVIGIPGSWLLWYRSAFHAAKGG